MSSSPIGHKSPEATDVSENTAVRVRGPVARSNGSEPALMQLQRTAGNAAVVAMVRGAQHDPGKLSRTASLQRAPTPAVRPNQEVLDLQKKTKALEKRQAATTQDLRWRGLYGAKLSSWKQVIFRVTAGIDTARGGFTAAQAKQADFDAMVTQLLMAVATVGFAAGFEPVMSGALMSTKIGGATANAEAKINAVKDIVEKIENPAVSAVSAQANIVGAAPKPDSSPPADGGLAAASAVGYMAPLLESLEGFSQRIETAFAARAGELTALSDDAAITLDTGKQEGIYATLMQELDAAASGVDKMKPAAAVAGVIERHIWAAWLKSKYLPGARTELGYSGPEFDGFGSYTEDRLNAIGVAQQANVELTGHWYSGNSAGYTDKLLGWARGYAGSITVGGPE